MTLLFAFIVVFVTYGIDIPANTVAGQRAFVLLDFCEYKHKKSENMPTLVHRVQMDCITGDASLGSLRRSIITAGHSEKSPCLSDTPEYSAPNTFFISGIKIRNAKVCKYYFMERSQSVVIKRYMSRSCDEMNY